MHMPLITCTILITVQLASYMYSEWSPFSVPNRCTISQGGIQSWSVMNMDQEDYVYRLLLECEHSKRVVDCKSKVDSLPSLLEKEVQKTCGRSDVELVFGVAECSR